MGSLLCKLSFACIYEKLWLYLDENKLLKYRGRIHDAPVMELAKIPYPIPPKCTLTDMIVMETHKCLH